MKAQLTQREKVLSIAVGSAAFLFVNFFVVDFFLKKKAALDLGIVRQKSQLAATRMRFAEKATWQEREAWLVAKQPKITNEDSAGVQLLDQVNKLASAQGVVLENPVIRPAARRPDTVAISVEVALKSPWKSLVPFMSALQQPDQFMVLEKANLKIDSKDQTQMEARFTVAKWYAPK